MSTDLFGEILEAKASHGWYDEHEASLASKIFFDYWNSQEDTFRLNTEKEQSPHHIKYLQYADCCASNKFVCNVVKSITLDIDFSTGV